MPNKFPRRESDILALAEMMIAGYAAHGKDFPSIGGPVLARARTAYVDARDAEIQVRAQAKLATEKKFELLNKLEEIMKNWLALSETDVASDSDKLAYIGWGPKSIPQPTDTPGQPRNLDSTLGKTKGNGTVFLDWKAPACRSGGKVRTYIVQRREQVGRDQTKFEPWKQVGIALETEVTLVDQPASMQLEYRVKAVNGAGESEPSNSVAVVL